MCVTHVTHYWQINWNCANCPPKNLHNSHIKYWLIVSLGCWNRWSFSYSYGQLAWLANDKSRIDGHHILHAYCFCCWAAERINYAKPMNSSPNRKCREIQIRNESDNEMHFSVWWLLLLGALLARPAGKSHSIPEGKRTEKRWFLVRLIPQILCHSDLEEMFEIIKRNVNFTQRRKMKKQKLSFLAAFQMR